MAVLFEDTFTGANGTSVLSPYTPDIGTGWTAHPLNVSNLGQIQNNRLYGGINNCWLYADDPGTNDYRVSCFDYRTGLSSADTVGNFLYARMSTSATTAYYVRRTDSYIVLGKLVSGSNTLLPSNVTLTSTVDGTMQIEVEGTSIRGYFQREDNNQWLTSSGTFQSTRVAFSSVTDASIASGRPGCNPTNSTTSARSHIDDFKVETLGDFDGDADDTISLTDVASAGLGLDVNASDTISLTDSAEIASDAELADDVMSLGDTATVIWVPSNVEQVFDLLNLSDSANAPSNPGKTDSINLQESASAVLGVPWQPIEVVEDLGLVDSLQRIITASVSDNLGLTEDFEGSYGIEDSLNLVETLNAGLGFSVIEVSDITDEVSSAGSIFNRTIQENVSLFDAALGYESDDKCARRFGVATGPVVTNKLYLTTFDGRYSVRLRNPEIDNIRRNSYRRVFRESRGGILNAFRDDSWVTIQTLLFTVQAMKTTMAEDLQQFFQDTLGEEIVLVDWDGEEWVGVVTNPQEFFVEDADGYWTLAFEFEGFKTNERHSGEYLTISDSATATL